MIIRIKNIKNIKTRRRTRRRTKCKTRRRTRRGKTRRTWKGQGGGDINDTQAKALIEAVSKDCIDSAQCLALSNTRASYIPDIFHNYDLKYAASYTMKSNITFIYAGQHAFVIKIPYTRIDYNSNAVMKCSFKQKYYDYKIDNIFYEAFVGAFINSQIINYPCFIQTYGCYTIADNLYDKIKKTTTKNKEEYDRRGNIIKKKTPFYAFGTTFSLTKQELTEGFTPFIQDIKYANFLNESIITRSCDTSICVLTQYLQYADALMTERLPYVKMYPDDDPNPKHKPEYTPEEYTNFISYYLMNYLYQVYCPLSIMNTKYQFIHRDIHESNILIYKPGKKNKDMKNKDIKEYITMTYHYSDTDKVSFNTFGISKIIDYGSCRFDDTSNGGSTDIFLNTITNEIVKTKFKSISHDRPEIRELEDYIQKNQRIINSIPYKTNTRRLEKLTAEKNDLLTPFFNAEDILLTYAQRKTGYTSVENQTNQQIINVHQMHQVLKKYIQGNKTFQDLNTSLFQNKKRIGHMDIYVDGSTNNMKYRPSN